MTRMQELEAFKKELRRHQDFGMQRFNIEIDQLLALINLAKFGQFYLNMRDLNEGPKADEFQEGAKKQALETGHIPTFAEYCKMMHEEAAR